MNTRRLLVAVAWSVACAVGVCPPARGQSGGKSDSARRAELIELLKLADAASGGEPVASALDVQWEPHFLKGTAGKTYVPFALTIAEHTRGRPVAMYVRVVRREASEARRTDDAVKKKDGSKVPWGALPIPTDEMPVGGVASRSRRTPGAAEASTVLALVDRERQAAHGQYAFEEVYFVDGGRDGGASHPYRIQRALAVGSGEYDVFVVVRENAASPREPPRAAVLKRSVSVPDFSRGDLAISSVIVAERLQPLSGPLHPRQQMERPYVIGTTEIVPALDPEFAAGEEPSVVFQIYNAALDEDDKPDITVDYRLEQQTDGPTRYLRRMAPQALNRLTLPGEFNPKAGHLLAAVQTLPIDSLPPGLYRLNIEVADNLASKSVTAEARFVVK